ncbi:MFS transporter [Brachybacterium sp. AOP25-B2-12]|uniref:MFS transporter n=1 Tax=Brachybacterium sp. AOP25-B2-12 TaxID=3457710 RepID=UPI004034481D
MPEAPQAPPSRRRVPRSRKRRLALDDINVVPGKKVRPAITGTVVGNFMEWYDFGIYGYLTVTMTAVFTAGLPDSLQLLAVMFGFAVSYIVRPIGGLVLGPLGDRIGRQKVLYFTMAAMAIATALIGLLPTAATVGSGAALVLLYLLKLVQGFSTGGEYAGATTYVAEFAPDKRRGYFGAYLDLGSYLGFAAGASMVAVVTLITQSISGPDAMTDYGWRIPFLTAIPLGAVAVYLRTRIPETPAFENEQQAAAAADTAVADEAERIVADAPREEASQPGAIRRWAKPLTTLISENLGTILVGIALVAAANSAGYALTSYMPVYLEEEIGLHTTGAALATVPALVVMALCLPLVGKLSDRVGRKPMYLAAVIAALVLMVPAFLLMHLNSFWAVMGAMFLVAIPVGLFVSMSASALPAMFPTKTRFSGMGLTYNVSVSLFGGTTPLVSQWLLQTTGISLMPAFYIMLFAALAGIALIWFQESARKPLLGSFPTVETHEEAQELYEGQDDNPDLDLSTMPFPEEVAPAEVAAGSSEPASERRSEGV